jgi:hypothetical protein
LRVSCLNGQCYFATEPAYFRDELSEAEDIDTATFPRSVPASQEAIYWTSRIPALCNIMAISILMDIDISCQILETQV